MEAVPVLFQSTDLQTYLPSRRPVPVSWLSNSKALKQPAVADFVDADVVEVLTPSHPAPASSERLTRAQVALQLYSTIYRSAERASVSLHVVV